MTGAGITRRRFVGDAGIAAVAATELMAGPALAARSKRRRKRRPTVAVFGGGIAGLTAAHELVERGFEVTVYERRAWGGKAHSTVVPGSAAGGRLPLPGEHGYRYEFGCYQNLTDTMRRIPFGSNPNGVHDNVVDTPLQRFARTTKHDLVLPTGPRAAQAYTPQEVLDLLLAVLVDFELPPNAVAYFAQRMGVFFSSCDARRLGQWEKTSWLDFIGADRYGEDYRKTLGKAPEALWSYKAPETSAKMIAWFFEVFYIYGVLQRNTIGPPFGTLNGPTSDVWIKPWLSELRRLGTRLRLRSQLTGLEMHRGRLAGARIRTPNGRRRVTADFYVCALPVERARRLWSPAILKADPRLTGMSKLSLTPMMGISYYVNRRIDITPGTNVCADSPWALSFLAQAQFWPGGFASRYGDGRAHDKLSALLCVWDEPGVLYGKRAYDCTPEEIAREVWAQIKMHANKPGQSAQLTDDMLLGYQIDPGALVRNNRVIEQDPLVIATVGTEQYRPEVATAIPNLMLCGDYLAGSWEVANMEAASYSARRVANAILARTSSSEPPAKAIPTYRPPEWEPLKRIDEDRYKRGQPNLFDADLTTAQVTELLRQPVG